MNRRVLLAVFLAALMALGTPASAYNASSSAALASDAGLEVGSQHTTDSDFQNAQTLENVSVEGSGESAAVTLSFADTGGEDDGSLGEYSGDTANFSASSSTVLEGSHSIKGTVDAENREIHSMSGLPAYPDAGDNFSFAWRFNKTGSGVAKLHFARQDANNRYEISQDKNKDSFKLNVVKNGTRTTLEGVSFAEENSTWYTVNVSWAKDGTMAATMSYPNGTKIATVNGQNTSFTSGGIGMVTFNGGIPDTNWWDDLRVNANQGRYISPNHTVDNARKTWANLTLQNASATVEAQAWDGTKWTIVNNSTYSATGNYTLNVSGTTYAKWRSNVTFQNKSGETTAELHDEGVLFQNDNPTVDNSAASPNDTTIQDDQATLSIPVNDSQFGTGQGDELTVEFFLNDTSEGTVTMTSNGTAEKTVTGLTGGNKQWHAEVTDSHGDTVTSDTFTFQVPDELRVYNESAPNDLVNETGVNITVRFYESGSDTVITRNTTDGTISMTGLDPGKQFIIVAKAEGYHDRRIIIDSLIEQQEIYLLNKSQDSVHNKFYLDDRTGTFDSEDTKLYIERALKKDWDGDGDDETRFNTVSADYFGASGGFPVDLRTDQRYRLRLQNDAGDTRILGSYTADAKGDVTLQVGSSTHDLGNKTENYQWEATYENESGPELSFKFNDSEDKTENLELVIFERGNQSNELYNKTHSGPFGSLAVSQPLTANQSEKTWVVKWEATRDGNTISGRRIIGKRSGPGIPLSPIWKHTASMALLIALGGLFGGVRAEMGAIIVSMVAGVLWGINWLPGDVTGGMVVLALGISILYHQAGGGR